MDAGRMHPNAKELVVWLDALIAERLDPERIPEVYHGGRPHPNDGRFYLLVSGRTEVLTKHQVETRVRFCEERGEIVTLRWASHLPDGSIVQ